MTFPIHMQGRNLVSHPSSGNMWTALHAGWLAGWRAGVEFHRQAWLPLHDSPVSIHPTNNTTPEQDTKRGTERMRDRESENVLVQDQQCLAVM